MYVFGNKKSSITARKPFVKRKIYKNIFIDIMYSITEFTKKVLVLLVSCDHDTMKTE